MNFQDVIRDVHDPVNHALQTTGGGATIFAVVNTGAAGVGNSMVTINPRTDYIGLMSISGNVAVGTPTVFMGTPTLYAVVNTTGIDTSMATLNAGPNQIGSVTVSNPIALDTGTKWVGLMTTWNSNQPALVAGVANIGFASITPVSSWPDPKTFVGLVTASNGLAWTDPKTFIGLVTATNGVAWPDPKTYIGLASVNIGGTLPALVASAAFIGIVTIANSITLKASTLNIGSISVLGGGIGLNAGVNNIGFATVTPINQALIASSAFIGFATTVNTTSTANIGSVSVLGGGIGLNAGVNNIGFATVTPINQALVASTVNIGSVSVLGGGIGLNAGVNSIGFATVTLTGAGNPSVFSVNVGTNKTLIPLPLTLTTASIATIAVATGGNAIFKVTNILLNSDATVRLNILSGATYLNGNVTVGITLNPGGGWVESGAPDSPIYLGLASGAAIVLQKFDLTATSAKIGGHLTYFQE